MKKNRTEFLIFTLTALAILALGFLPNWAGYQAQDTNQSFRGLYFDSIDYSVHIAMMQSGIQGDWLYQLRFTTESQNSAAIKLFYVALGHFSHLVHLPAETTYQLFSWILGYLALFSIFLLCKRVFKEKKWYWSAFILAVLGSGLGWLQVLTGWIPGQISPIDFWLIDAYVFFSISLFPHFSFQIALLAFSLLAYIKFLDARKWYLVGFILIASLLVELVNPISLAVLDIALFTSTLFYWLKTRSGLKPLALALVIIAVVQIPLLAYNAIILTRDPVFSQFNSQNLTLSPPPVYYLLGFALLLPFSVIGMIDAWKKRDFVFMGFAGWVISAFILAYLPLNFQRRFLLGITIPLALLSIQGLTISLDFLSRKFVFFKKHYSSFSFLYISLAVISSICLSLGNVGFMKSQPDAFFYPKSYDPALVWLQDRQNKNAVVLADTRTSQLVAQKAGLRVYVRHLMETIHFDEKQSAVALAFEQNMPESFLSPLPVDWVIYGPYEQVTAPNFQPGSNLFVCYQLQDVTVYKVLQSTTDIADPTICN
jgi:hypothetical protein